jgi:hypothetical protein
MDLSSPNDTSIASSSSSSTTALYYYNGDAILRELIHPTTPKHENLARPWLIKPEPIRPQQLVVVGACANPVTKSNVLVPFVMGDRNEGARNG